MEKIKYRKQTISGKKKSRRVSITKCEKRDNIKVGSVDCFKCWNFLKLDDFFVWCKNE